jgi:4-hydroxybenzoate polyprenyltransferase
VNTKPDPIRRRSTLLPQVLFGGAYAIAYIAALWSSNGSLPVSLPLLLTVAAAIAFVGFVLAELRAVRLLDELQQRIQLEALAFAFPASVGVVMLLGLLQRFQELPAADLSYRHVWPVMIFLYVSGLALARRRYT